MQATIEQRTEIAERMKAYKPPPRNYPRGYYRLFAQHTRQANEGCDFHFLEGAGAFPSRKSTDARLQSARFSDDDRFRLLTRDLVVTHKVIAHDGSAEHGRGLQCGPRAEYGFIHTRPEHVPEKW